MKEEESGSRVTILQFFLREKEVAGGARGQSRGREGRGVGKGAHQITDRVVTAVAVAAVVALELRLPHHVHVHLLLDVEAVGAAGVSSGGATSTKGAE